jgi:hypothetical protein
LLPGTTQTVTTTPSLWGDKKEAAIF